MMYGTYISAAGAMAQSQRVEALSNNIANADTVGFKRELAVMQARNAEAVERGQVGPGGRGVENVGGGVSMKQTLTEFSPGPMRETGIPTDMAIDGEGFFQVQRDGQTFLTRAGNFRLADGKLVTQNGEQVLSEGGGPVQIDPARPWRLMVGGVVQQDGSDTPLSIVKPRSAGDLVKTGDNLFSALAPATPVPAGERRVAGGFLELSAVKPTLEMTELIEASRAFETNVRMIQSQDQLAGTLIGRLLRA